MLHIVNSLYMREKIPGNPILEDKAADSEELDFKKYLAAKDAPKKKGQSLDDLKKEFEALDEDAQSEHQEDFLTGGNDAWALRDTKDPNLEKSMRTMPGAHLAADLHTIAEKNGVAMLFHRDIDYVRAAVRLYQRETTHLKERAQSGAVERRTNLDDRVLNKFTAMCQSPEVLGNMLAEAA